MTVLQATLCLCGVKDCREAWCGDPMMVELLGLEPGEVKTFDCKICGSPMGLGDGAGGLRCYSAHKHPVPA